MPGAAGFPSSPLRLTAANVASRRFDQDALAAGSGVIGTLNITAGDFDADGRQDVAIGAPISAVLANGLIVDLVQRGQVDVAGASRTWATRSCSTVRTKTSTTTDARICSV